jgi:hypothetical protein
MIPILLLVTASFQPPKPTVGDPITIRFEQPVSLDKSANYEIVSQKGNTVVIRTFQPMPFTISGQTGDVRFQNMIVPVHSVLKENDDMKPAGLRPPVRESYPRMPFYLIAAAALAAIAAWTAAALRREKKLKPPVPALPPDEQFRAAVRALRDGRGVQQRWSKLADALRDYLAATTELSHDLTTTEVLARWSGAAFVATILHQGDLEKFSPWGPAAGDFHSVATQALTLAPEPVQEVAA